MHLVPVPLEKKKQWSFRARSNKRFPLVLYSRLKKEGMHVELQKRLDSDEHVKEKKSQLEEKSVELKELQGELHRTEERIRQGKRKVPSKLMYYSAVSGIRTKIEAL